MGRSSYGIARDINGNFYIIDSGNIKPLAAPISDSQTEFAIAPNHTVYLVGTQGTYAGTPATGFHKIYGLSQLPLAITASNQGLALIYNSGEGPIKGSVEKVVLLDSSGNVKYQKTLDALAGRWSPSGKYLLLTNGSGARIFDSSLNQVSIIPAGSVSSPAWLNDDDLIYGVNNQLWKYRISSGLSQMLAKAADNHAIENIVLTNDDSYAYLSVQSTPNSGNDLTIQRLGLRSQGMQSFISTLQNNLPWLSGGCLMYLTNFTAPTIQINNIQPGVNCQQVAQSYIGQLGIDASRIQYKQTDVPPDEPAN